MVFNNTTPTCHLRKYITRIIIIIIIIIIISDTHKHTHTHTLRLTRETDYYYISVGF